MLSNLAVGLCEVESAVARDSSLAFFLRIFSIEFFGEESQYTRPESSNGGLVEESLDLFVVVLVEDPAEEYDPILSQLLIYNVHFIVFIIFLFRSSVKRPSQCRLDKENSLPSLQFSQILLGFAISLIMIDCLRGFDLVLEELGDL